MGPRARGDAGAGAVDSSLTGLYPWGRYALSERLATWGVAGYGEGTLALTPEGEGPLRTELDLVMAVVGVRGVVVDAPAQGGLELAVETDALGVWTRTAQVRGLAAEHSEVTRLRLALEGARPVRFEGGARLVPSVELGVRHDGGDAETGFGADLGGGLAWSDPRRGLSGELRGRGLLSHAAEGFHERGFSGALSWDATPATARGLSLSMRHTVGARAAGGMEALYERGTLSGLGGDESAGGGSAPARPRFEMRLGYGLPVFGERFTGTPELGLGLSGARRDYRLGWRLTRESRSGAPFHLILEAQRREGADDDAAPVHALGLRLTARF